MERGDQPFQKSGSQPRQADRGGDDTQHHPERCGDLDTCEADGPSPRLASEVLFLKTYIPFPIAAAESRRNGLKKKLASPITGLAIANPRVASALFS